MSEDKIQKVFKIPNLGRFITEQTMSFCQTVFHRELVDALTNDLHSNSEGQGVITDKALLKKIKEHIERRKDDPIPIPLDDLGALNVLL
jgi:pyranose oxidase